MRVEWVLFERITNEHVCNGEFKQSTLIFEQSLKKKHGIRLGSVFFEYLFHGFIKWFIFKFLISHINGMIDIS